MRSHVLMMFSCLALALSSACSFSLGGFPDTEIANKLGAESLALEVEGMKLRDEALAKWQSLIKAAGGFDEWTNLEAPLKDVIAQVEAGQGKLREAVQKCEEIGKQNVAESLKQYHAARADRTRKEADVIGLQLQMVKMSYDPAIETEEDFVKKSDEINAKVAAARKEQEAIAAKIDKIVADHPTEFTKK